MRFMSLRHCFSQLMLLILSLYMVHAHYSELDAIYGMLLIPSQASAFMALAPLWH